MKNVFFIGLLFIFTPLNLSGDWFSFDPQKWQRVIINEVMINPSGIEDQFGEWIELYNPFDEKINIQGFILMDSKKDFHIISPSNPLFIDGKGYLVLGKIKKYSKISFEFVDYDYGQDINFDNISDDLLLIWGNSIVDTIWYDEKTSYKYEGHSMNLEPDYEDFSSFKKIWCPSKKPMFDDKKNSGTPKEKNTFCDNDEDGYAEDDGDCNDSDGSIFLNAKEVCDGVDNNCNGKIDEDLIPPSICLNEGVCKGVIPVCNGFEGWQCFYGENYEGGEELSCDGQDNDCDGLIDEEISPSIACLQKGVCYGSSPLCYGKDGWKCNYPSSYENIETKCDGLDNDCDGETDEGFEIGKKCKKGYGVCEKEGKFICAEDKKTAVCDAKEGEPSLEICGDGLDNNCNGITDEGFKVGDECFVGEGICRVGGKFKCSDDGLSVVCSAPPLQPQEEECENQKDDDCDGKVDEEDCVLKKKGGGGGCFYGNKTSLPLFFAVFFIFICFRKAICDVNFINNIGYLLIISAFY